MSSEQIDVLAVMDTDGHGIAALCDTCDPGTLRERQWVAHLAEHNKARDAVAELVEACAPLVELWEAGSDMDAQIELVAAALINIGVQP